MQKQVNSLACQRCAEWGVYALVTVMQVLAACAARYQVRTAVLCTLTERKFRGGTS